MVSPTNIGETLHWSYANLAMAHAAVSQGAAKYGVVHYSIRSKLFKGLSNGSMSVGPIADDERLKLILPQACAYCGGREKLAADHLVPRHRGGEDSGDNLIWACRSCNSSKGAQDLLAWYEARKTFPPLLLVRRYLKLALVLCDKRNLMSSLLSEARELPMDIARVPLKFPQPNDLHLWWNWIPE